VAEVVHKENSIAKSTLSTLMLDKTKEREACQSMRQIDIILPNPTQSKYGTKSMPAYELICQN